MTRKPFHKIQQIAVDFDGTCVEHRYPSVGNDVPHAVRTLHDLISIRKIRLILFTMRGGKELNDAIKWFNDKDIILYGIQRDPLQDRWTNSPKAYGELYIDDAAFGVPLITLPFSDVPMVDWLKVREYFELDN